jgi:SAM-dependent methyltransferase
MVGRRIYDLMYRWWAPWDGVGVRADLRQLLETEVVTAATHPTAIDLGCGTGANVVHLGAQGFEVVGVDFSQVALAKAATRAREAGVEERCRFVQADLTSASLPEIVGGPFDLVTDFGTLDDLDGDGRAALASNVAAVMRPGAVFLLWCFYGPRAELPAMSFTGPSRVAPGIEPGELERLFADAFEIDEFSREHDGVACFLLRRR